MRNIFNITYKKPHNPHHTLPQNANRNIRISTVKGTTALNEKIKEFKNAGFPIVHIFNGCGEFVNL